MVGLGISEPSTAETYDFQVAHFFNVHFQPTKKTDLQTSLRWPKALHRMATLFMGCSAEFSNILLEVFFIHAYWLYQISYLIRHVCKKRTAIKILVVPISDFVALHALQCNDFVFQGNGRVTGPFWMNFWLPFISTPFNDVNLSRFCRLETPIFGGFK